MPTKDMGLKKKNLTGYMGGGVMYSKAPTSKSFRKGGTTKYVTGGITSPTLNPRKDEAAKLAAKKRNAGLKRKRAAAANNPKRRGG